MKNLSKGTVKTERNKIKIIHELCRQSPQPRGARRMRAGGAYHDRTRNLKYTYIHIISHILFKFKSFFNTILDVLYIVKFSQNMEQCQVRTGKTGKIGLEFSLLSIVQKQKKYALGEKEHIFVLEPGTDLHIR